MSRRTHKKQIENAIAQIKSIEELITYVKTQKKSHSRDALISFLKIEVETYSKVNANYAVIRKDKAKFLAFNKWEETYDKQTNQIKQLKAENKELKTKLIELEKYLNNGKEN